MKKNFNSETIITVALFIVISAFSFYLGKLSALHEIKISEQKNISEKNHIMTITKKEAVPVGVIASKKGTKYHLPWCPGATSMTSANKIYFNSIAEAEAAGYEPAKNCEGL